jgi:phage major head subunit gpT-like protein
MAGTYLNRSVVEAAYVVFSTVFNMKLQNTPNTYDKIATVVPGVSERVEFKWMADLPVMKRWVGDRFLTKLRAEGVALTPEWWANGLEVDADDLRSDARLALIMAFVRELARMGGVRIDASVIDMYRLGTAGTQGLCFDGQYLYDTDHSAGTGTTGSQSNILSGAFSSASWNTALQKVFYDSQGEPVDAVPTMAWGGPQNQLLFRNVFNVDRVGSGADNVDRGTGTFFVTPRISGTEWFTIAGNNELRPVLLGIEAPPEFVASEDPRATEMFMRRTALYGAHVKFGCCYGFWQCTMRSPGT